MVDWGFDFIRLPMAYPRYVEFDRSKRISPEEVCKINDQEVDRLEAFVRKAQQHGLHVSLNLHRAPGYCINAGFYEPYDLWKDKEAQQAFFFHWGMWGKRFKEEEQNPALRFPRLVCRRARHSYHQPHRLRPLEFPGRLRDSRLQA
jgi:aryl-phospho-beta-D-glucosidase BglC (GH1 family)